MRTSLMKGKRDRSDSALLKFDGADDRQFWDHEIQNARIATGSGTPQAPLSP